MTRLDRTIRLPPVLPTPPSSTTRTPAQSGPGRVGSLAHASPFSSLMSRPSPCPSPSPPQRPAPLPSSRAHSPRLHVPSKIASASLHALSVSSDSGTPCASIDAPPKSCSVISSWSGVCLVITSSTRTAAEVTSGPIPSPGRTVILYLTSERVIRDKSVGADRTGRGRDKGTKDKGKGSSKAVESGREWSRSFVHCCNDVTSSKAEEPFQHEAGRRCL